MQPNSFVKRVLGYGVSAGILASSVHAFAAHDPKLDQALAHSTKAASQLTAAQNATPKKDFGGHRRRAIAYLKHAAAEIEKAKEFQEKPPAARPAVAAAKPAAAKSAAPAAKRSAVKHTAAKPAAKHPAAKPVKTTTSSK